MKNIIKNLNLIDSKNNCVIEQPSLLYFTGFSGMIKYNIIQKAYPKSLILINNYSVNNVNFIKTPVLYNEWHDIFITENSQIMIIRKDFYADICSPYFEDGTIEHIHSNLINKLLELISQSSKPIYEILALANIIGVDSYNTNLDKDLLKIKDSIENNSIDSNFNLNKLCGIVYMSRRKIQYILSNAELSFLDILNGYRVRELKVCLLKEPRTALDINIYRVGFKSVNTANRVFKKQYGLSISEYRRSIQRNIRYEVIDKHAC